MILPTSTITISMAGHGDERDRLRRFVLLPRPSEPTRQSRTCLRHSQRPRKRASSRAIHRPSLPTTGGTLDAARAPYGGNRATTGLCERLFSEHPPYALGTPPKTMKTGVWSHGSDVRPICFGASSPPAASGTRQSGQAPSQSLGARSQFHAVETAASTIAFVLANPVRATEAASCSQYDWLNSSSESMPR